MTSFDGGMTRREALCRIGGSASAAAALAVGDLPAGSPAASQKTKAFIWDAHGHLGGARTPEESIARSLRYADRMGIERVVVSMGMSFVYDPTPEELRRQNDDVLRAVRFAPERVFGFVYVNPKHVAESLQEMDRCVRDGPMVGVKLWVAMHCNEPSLDPIVRRAAELKAPILQHTFLKVTGNLPGESTPADLVELARRHPDASFLCAHTGADWERGIRWIREAKNIASEISGSDPTAGMVEMAVRELGAERVIYGSDFPGRSFASQLAKVDSAELSEAARRLILGENLRRMLLPILTAKGIRA